MVTPQNQRKATRATKSRSANRKRIGQRRPRTNPTSQRVAAATNVGAVFKMPTNRLSTLPNGVVCVHNKEIVQTISVTATAGVIAPAAVPAITVSITSAGNFPWLGKFGDIYDKFCFKSLKITFVPTLPTTTSGSIAIYYDSDESTAPASFPAAATNEAALVCPIFEQSSTTIPKHMLSALPWYSGTTTSTSPTTQGDILAYHTGITLLNSAAAGTTTIGYIMVEYVVHMKNASAA